MNSIARNTFFMMMALLLAGAVWTAQPVNKSLPMGPDGEVDIEALAGKLTIEAWDRDVVEVTGTLGDGVDELDFEAEDDGVSIEVVYDEDYHGKQQVSTDLTVRMPVGASLSIETVSASISVSGVTGEVELETVSGDIVVATRPGSLDAETVSGNVSIQSAPNETDVSSVSGTIEIQSASGMLDAENVSGEILIRGGLLDEGDLSSVSGDITCHAVPRAGGDLDVETTDGTITLVVDPSLVASFELSTFSGSIENKLGPAPSRTSKYTPGKELHFNTGTGGPRISLETFSGSIKLLTR